MKNLMFTNTKFKVVLVIVAMLMLSACGGGDSGSDEPPVIPPPGGGTPTNPPSGGNTSIDPSNSAELSAALIVPGSSRVDGSMPMASNSPSQPQITRSEQTLAYTPNSQVLLPIDYQAAGGADIVEILFSVKGANEYFSTAVSNSGVSGTVVLPVNLPSSVSDGEFCVDIKLIDSNGFVSSEQTVCVTVSQALQCDEIKVSGGEGITSTLHQMDGNTGTVKIDYETFTVKDKIDVFQNGFWIAGTGVNTDRSSIRTALNCSQATEALGYVGRNSEFLFGYDAALGGNIEVVVSGCENNGTAWNYIASCPGDFGVCAVDADCAEGEVCLSGQCAGQGVLRFSLKWSAEADYDLYVLTPLNTLIGFSGVDAADGGEWDVDNVNGGPGAVENIFFDSTLSSGTYEVYVDNYSGDAGSWTIEVYVDNVRTQIFSGTFSGQSGEESARFTIDYQ